MERPIEIQHSKALVSSLIASFLVMFSIIGWMSGSLVEVGSGLVERGVISGYSALCGLVVVALTVLGSVLSTALLILTLVGGHGRRVCHSE